MFQLLYFKPTVRLKNSISIVLLLILLQVTATQARDTVFIKDSETEYSLTEHSSYLEDKDGIWDIDDVVSESSQYQWKQESGKSINFGYSKSAYWFKLNLQNIEPTAKDSILIIGAKKVALLLLKATVYAM